MDEIDVVIERHTQQIAHLDNKVEKLEGIMTEMRTMSETLITVANELKHTNQAVSRLEVKMTDIENQPRKRYDKIKESIIGAVIGGTITVLIGGLIWVLQNMKGG